MNAFHQLESHDVIASWICTEHFVWNYECMFVSSILCRMCAFCVEEQYEQCLCLVSCLRSWWLRSPLRFEIHQPRFGEGSIQREGLCQQAVFPAHGTLTKILSPYPSSLAYTLNDPFCIRSWWCLSLVNMCLSLHGKQACLVPRRTSRSKCQRSPITWSI